VRYDIDGVGSSRRRRRIDADAVMNPLIVRDTADGLELRPELLCVGRFFMVSEALLILPGLDHDKSAVTADFLECVHFQISRVCAGRTQFAISAAPAPASDGLMSI
jgi:hypothetical protein